MNTNYRLSVKHVETGHLLEVTQSMYDFSPESYELLPPVGAAKESAGKSAAKPGQQADPKEGSD